MYRNKALTDKSEAPTNRKHPTVGCNVFGLLAAISHDTLTRSKKCVEFLKTVERRRGNETVSIYDSILCQNSVVHE